MQLVEGSGVVGGVQGSVFSGTGRGETSIASALATARSFDAEARNGVTKVFMATLGMTTIPDEVFSLFPNMISLDVRYNSLRTFPRALYTMTRLHTLIAWDNPIKRISSRVTNLTILRI